MQKLFIRVGSHYYAESPQLDGDLEPSSLIGGVPVVAPKEKEKQETKIDYESQIQALNKRIDDLTGLINEKSEIALPTVESKVEEKPKDKTTSKKLDAKKK